VSIRRIAASDLDVIAQMTLEFETYLYGLVGKKTHTKIEKVRAAYRKAGLGARDVCGGFIAEDKNGAAGFALCYLGFRSDQHGMILEVPDIFVRERARGAGIGKQLMLALRKHAKSLGCVRVELSVWNHNPQALKFYLDLGLKPVSDEMLMGWKIG
jgi:GNAT superfamily N-acetyltransferase